MCLAGGEYVFAAAGPAVELPANTLAVAWTMTRRDDGTSAGGGHDLLALDADGRIVSDHQFIEGSVNADDYLRSGAAGTAVISVG